VSAAAAGRREDEAVDLAGQRWDSLPVRPVVLLPTGSTEQHGPHLPLDTDSVIATAAASAVARSSSRDLPGTRMLVAPTVPYGASGEHQAFPGTISIGHEALSMVVTELVRSLSPWAGRIVVVNAHGGNVPSVAAVVSQMIDEGHDVAWVPCLTAGGDAHAGRTETSLMLHLDPGRVDLASAVQGNTSPLEEILPVLASRGVRAVSPSGILGDPTDANAAEGERLFRSMVDEIRLRIEGGLIDQHGRLREPAVPGARP
jgi:mycofactocin precursor peptide peptidase